MKNYKIWLVLAIIFQFLTAAMHSISLFVPMHPTDPSEETLVRLFTTQQLNFGSGIHRTLYEVFLSVSMCLTLLFLFGGMMNVYMLRKKVALDIFRGVIAMQVLIFGVCFLGVLFLAFLPPMVLTGLTFFFLLATLAAISAAMRSPVAKISGNG